MGLSLNDWIFVSARQIGICQIHFAFLYETKIWDGANSTDVIISKIDLLITPLNKKITDGITESANALKTLVFFQQITHIAQ